MYNVNDVIKIAHSLGVMFDRFGLEDLVRGLEIELEHGKRDSLTNITNDDLELTMKIALAHLNEFPDYYNEDYGLPAFENSLKKRDYY